MLTRSGATSSKGWYFNAFYNHSVSVDVQVWSKNLCVLENGKLFNPRPRMFIEGYLRSCHVSKLDGVCVRREAKRACGWAERKC